MPIEALQAFQAVAQARSFTKAAAVLGTDKSRLSRIVRGLERRLDTSLLVRTTRRVSLTAEGEQLFARVAPVLAELHDAVSAMSDRAALPAGEVGITTTPDLGRALLAPALAAFRQQFPAVSVRVVLGHDLVDLVAAGVDLALRVGAPGPSTFKVRRLGTLSAGFFASPGYLARRPAPQSMAELSTHDGLWPSVPRGQRTFASSQRPTRKPAIQCDDFSMLAELARLGTGVAVLPMFLAERDVATGALVRVLPSVTLSNAPLFLVSRPATPPPPRVKALADFLAAQLRTR